MITFIYLLIVLFSSWAFNWVGLGVVVLLDLLLEGDL